MTTLQFEIKQEQNADTTYTIKRKGIEVGLLLLDTQYEKAMKNKKEITIK